MSIEAFMKRLCKNDTAVYWASPTPDVHGKNAFDAPVVIQCFWNGEEDLIRDDDGREIKTVAKIYVEQDLDEQGMLFHGDLDDLDAGQEADPTTVRDAYEIKKFEKKPSRNKVGEFMRMAMI